MTRMPCDRSLCSSKPHALPPFLHLGRLSSTPHAACRMPHTACLSLQFQGQAHWLIAAQLSPAQSLLLSLVPLCSRRHDNPLDPKKHANYTTYYGTVIDKRRPIAAQAWVRPDHRQNVGDVGKVGLTWRRDKASQPKAARASPHLTPLFLLGRT